MSIAINSAIKATTSALRVALYNELTKKGIKKFSSVDAGISQCLGAAKAAGDDVAAAALAKVGVSLEAPAQESTPEAKKPSPAPKAKAQREKAESAKPVAEKGKSRIMQKIDALKKKPKRAVAEKAEPRKAAITKVKPTFAGTSKVQEASTRAKVLAFINEHKKGVTVEEVTKHIKQESRGYIQKLIDKQHVEVME